MDESWPVISGGIVSLCDASGTLGVEEVPNHSGTFCVDYLLSDTALYRLGHGAEVLIVVQ